MTKEFILILLKCTWKVWIGKLIPRSFEQTKGHIYLELLTKEESRNLYWIEK